MSETIEALKKERDELKAKLAEATKGAEALKKERDGFKALSQKDDGSRQTLLGIHVALGLDDDADPLAAVERLLTDTGPVPSVIALVKPEEKGTRRFGSEATEGRYIAIEEIAFEQDLGYGFDSIERRAESMVKRCVAAAGGTGEDGKFNPLLRLPNFDTSRVLLVTLEVL